jgi:hypothetical protein
MTENGTLAVGSFGSELTLDLFRPLLAARVADSVSVNGTDVIGRATFVRQIYRASGDKINGANPMDSRLSHLVLPTYLSPSAGQVLPYATTFRPDLAWPTKSMAVFAM